MRQRVSTRRGRRPHWAIQRSRPIEKRPRREKTSQKAEQELIREEAKDNRRGKRQKSSRKSVYKTLTTVLWSTSYYRLQRLKEKANRGWSTACSICILLPFLAYFSWVVERINSTDMGKYLNLVGLVQSLLEVSFFVPFEAEMLIKVLKFKDFL